MSQSDYIRYKKIEVELQEQKKLAPVIGSGQYINYKSFTLKNTILSDNVSYTKIMPKDSVNIFGMQMNKPLTCASFALCKNTNDRANRKPLLGTQSNAQPLPFTRKKPHKTPADLNICKCINV